jgi:1,4-alpha-glucan branching enzyme
LAEKFSTGSPTTALLQKTSAAIGPDTSRARDGDRYRFWVEGLAQAATSAILARANRSRRFPDCFCILRAGDGFPWHDQDFVTPDFSDMIVYQLHIGTFAIRKPGVASNSSTCPQDPYLADLGINVLQPLPVDEQECNPNMGYSGADLFSPDFPISRSRICRSISKAQWALRGETPSALALADIQSGPGSSRLVDLAISRHRVVFDVVYNHAGGFSIDGRLDDNCLYYMDRRPDRGNNNDSLYFTDQDRGTGGLAFALWNDDVSRFSHRQCALLSRRAARRWLPLRRDLHADLDQPGKRMAILPRADLEPAGPSQPDSAER